MGIFFCECSFEAECGESTGCKGLALRQSLYTLFSVAIQLRYGLFPDMWLPAQAVAVLCIRLSPDDTLPGSCRLLQMICRIVQHHFIIPGGLPQGLRRFQVHPCISFSTLACISGCTRLAFWKETPSITGKSHIFFILSIRISPPCPSALPVSGIFFPVHSALLTKFRIFLMVEQKSTDFV